MDETWTLSDLVRQATTLIAALPAPTNGQVRAVPDERTIRYYGTLGLLARPVAMRGRTALYGARHLAQVVAIKRLQTAGRSLAEIQELWPRLDDATLSRMTGVVLAGVRTTAAARPDFWKREPVRQREVAEPVAPPLAPTDPLAPPPKPPAMPPLGAPARSAEGGGGGDAEVGWRCELRIELAPDVVLAIAIPDEGEGIALEPADVRALRAAAASLVDELAKIRLGKHVGGEEP